MLQGWFFNTPLECIRRGNLASWASWAFFDLDPSDLSEQQRGENEQIVDFIADKAKWTFPPGKYVVFCDKPPVVSHVVRTSITKSVRATHTYTLHLNSPAGYAEDVLTARLSLDPIFAVQRPLYFYLAIGLLNYCTHLFLNHVLGFKRLRKYDSPSQYVYYRAAQNAQTNSATFTKTTTSTTDTTTNATTTTSTNTTDSGAKVPLVFVHGIGIGFAHYLGMIMSFPTDTDVFLIEWPHVGEFLDINVLSYYLCVSVSSYVLG